MLLDIGSWRFCDDYLCHQNTEWLEFCNYQWVEITCRLPSRLRHRELTWLWFWCLVRRLPISQRPQRFLFRYLILIYLKNMDAFPAQWFLRVHSVMDLLSLSITYYHNLSEQVTTFLKNFKSIPAFMGNLTVELFNKTTINWCDIELFDRKSGKLPHIVYCTILLSQ